MQQPEPTGGQPDSRPEQRDAPAARARLPIADDVHPFRLRWRSKRRPGLTYSAADEDVVVLAVVDQAKADAAIEHGFAKCPTRAGTAPANAAALALHVAGGGWFRTPRRSPR